MTKEKKNKKENKNKTNSKETASKTKEKDELELLKESLESAEDAKLRALAETENMRRRMDKERQENARYGATSIAKDLLTVIDNFERALTAYPKRVENKKDMEKNYVSLHEGVELTLKEIIAIFNRNGIEIIDPKKGDVFDHNLHQAMLEVSTSDYKPGSICEVLQPGYKIYDRLLRPAMVGVSKEK